jgi:molecular chaperone GrpE
MTSARKRPAGAPDDWSDKGPAGTPGEESPVASRQSPDSEPEADAEDQGGDVADDLDALLADVQRERDEYLELAQRAKADFENFRKRAARDAAEAEKRGKGGLARELVPAIDNLERALSSVGIDPQAGVPTGEDGEPRSEEVSSEEAFARGVALVLGELRATLQRAGVETYDPVGEAFDPAWHEALATRVVEGGESGTVIETLERGYRLDGQVLRPARVVVSE